MQHKLVFVAILCEGGYAVCQYVPEVALSVT